ncbi:MAG: hypothetical protein ACR65W_12310 [Methylocystis sp.]|uniref:hypothetical protein n=1 Tax=Methylocystis sp. TaxID=1911079 RepID=UPI003DA40763
MTDFFDENLLQHFDFERFLIDHMIHVIGKRSRPLQRFAMPTLSGKAHKQQGPSRAQSAEHARLKSLRTTDVF